MRCPECSAWSSVLATRREYRRRECANGHRFWTLEVPVVNNNLRLEAMSKSKKKTLD